MMADFIISIMGLKTGLNIIYAISEFQTSVVIILKVAKF